MILGAVLAGGASSRFGSNKAAAELGGTTLLDHARAAIAHQVDDVIVVGAANGGIPDVPEPGLGPLGGIAAALDHAAVYGFASVLTIGCDMPQVPDELIAALLRRAPAYCSDAPVLGHWPAALALALIAHLSEANRDAEGQASRPHSRLDPESIAVVALSISSHGRPEEDIGRRRSASLSVRRWAALVGAIPIPAAAPLRNINTPADLLPA